jgi:hypothetical protein
MQVPQSIVNAIEPYEPEGADTVTVLITASCDDPDPFDPESFQTLGESLVEAFRVFGYDTAAVRVVVAANDATSSPLTIGSNFDPPEEP